jgi:hypothetical protein
MSVKNALSSTEVVRHRRYERQRLAIIIAGAVLLVGLALGFSALQSGNSQVAVPNEDPIVLGNAMALHYAQPWLDRQIAVAASTVSHGDAMAMQYAQPWLDRQLAQGVSSISYGNALAMHYAQPWLDRQLAQSVSSISHSTTLGRALAMQYAQPWLDAHKDKICNGRLDLMYACANGYQP